MNQNKREDRYCRIFSCCSQGVYCHISHENENIFKLNSYLQQLAAKINVPAKRAVSDPPKPAPVIPMTDAMKAIGAAKSPPPP